MSYHQENLNINIFLFGLNPNHCGILHNLYDSFFTLHLFSKSKFLTHSKLNIQYHQIVQENEKNFLIELQKITKNVPDPKIMIPATDAEILFLDKHRQKLKNFILCLSSSEVIKVVSNKYLIQNALNNHGLNYPRSVLIEDKATLQSSVSSLRFPCIIKPVFSNEWKTTQSGKILGQNKALLVREPCELQSVYEKVFPISQKVIAQEIITQKGLENYSFCSYSDKNGNILHGFVTQKIVQYPDKFGTAVLCRTVKNPRIAEYGKKVIKALKLEGIAETEIIVDAETDDLYVIEVNPRHWMQHRLATRLGVNYTLLDIYYRLGMKDMVQKCLSGKKPDKEIVWIDDVGYLFYAGKRFLNPKKCFFRDLLLKKREFSLFSLRDWRPFWYSLKSKLRPA